MSKRRGEFLSARVPYSAMGNLSDYKDLSAGEMRVCNMQCFQLKFLSFLF